VFGTWKIDLTLAVDFGCCWYCFYIRIKFFLCH
jgi:hypothetical protein